MEGRRRCGGLTAGEIDQEGGSRTQLRPVATRSRTRGKGVSHWQVHLATVVSPVGDGSLVCQNVKLKDFSFVGFCHTRETRKTQDVPLNFPNACLQVPPTGSTLISKLLLSHVHVCGIAGALLEGTDRASHTYTCGELVNLGGGTIWYNILGKRGNKGCRNVHREHYYPPISS